MPTSAGKAAVPGTSKEAPTSSGATGGPPGAGRGGLSRGRGRGMPSRGLKNWQKLSAGFHGESIPDSAEEKQEATTPEQDVKDDNLAVTIVAPSTSAITAEGESKKKEGRTKVTTETQPVTEKREENKFLKGMATLRFLAKLRAGSRKKQQEEEVDDEEEILPEATRRFLFDDKALKKGETAANLMHDDTPEEDINEIVDKDDGHIETFVSQELVGNLIESFTFRLFIMLLIIINAALIGMQTYESMHLKYKHFFYMFDQLVLATFTCELLLKWYYGFWIFWKVGWNVLDFIIIVMLLIGPSLSFMSISRILRILRVVRAFRSVRNVSALAGLSMVVQTILQSVPDMANIVMLLVIIMLVLAVSGVTLFGQWVPTHFGGLGEAMYSLFVCMTQDGWVELYEAFVNTGGNPAKDKVRGTLEYVGGGYFLICIFILAFIFANLVVAVVVTNLEIAMNDLKEERKKQVDTLASTLDQVADDTISGDTIEKAPTLGLEDLRQIDFTAQVPLEKADLRGVTPAKLENYFMLLMALEDNLAEYQDIKQDLSDMYDMVKELNTLDEDEGEDDLIIKMPASSINTKTLKKGDILSNLMKLEEDKALKSEDAHTIDDVIRSTARPKIVSRKASTKKW